MQYDLSIIIPCLNEQDNIIPCLEKVDALIKKNELKAEVIIIDDKFLYLRHNYTYHDMYNLI